MPAETDLETFPPYSIGIFRRGADAGRENLSGPEAIVSAKEELGDPAVLGVEIYDSKNNLVAVGGRETCGVVDAKGEVVFRLIRKLADITPSLKFEPATAPAAPTFKVEKVPQGAELPYFSIAGVGEARETIEIVENGETTEISAVELASEKRNVRKLLEAALFAKLFLEGSQASGKPCVSFMLGKLAKDYPGAAENASRARERLEEALAGFVGL
jgi:hypothetical protein